MEINRLYFGDNLTVLREKIPDDSIDLCYIDPPFNSARKSGGSLGLRLALSSLVGRNHSLARPDQRRQRFAGQSPFFAFVPKPPTEITVGWHGLQRTTGCRHRVNH